MKNARNILISVILLILSVSFISSTFRVVRRGSRLIEAKKELESLQKQKIALEKKSAYRSSPEFVEEEARNKLNMVKPGEEVYLKPKIVGDDLLGSQAERPSKEKSPGNPLFFGRLFDKIKEFLLLFQG